MIIKTAILLISMRLGKQDSLFYAGINDGHAFEKSYFLRMIIYLFRHLVEAILISLIKRRLFASGFYHR